MKNRYINMLFSGFVIALTLVVSQWAGAQGYCPPYDYPDYTVECFDEDGVFWGCCETDFPICIFDYDTLFCDSDSSPSTVPSTSTTIFDSPATTSIPGEGTTTIPSGTTTTVSQSPTTTVPGGAATTTISQYCANDTDGPLECLDLPNQKYWCCPEDYPICGDGSDYGMCLQESGTTTTVSGEGTTTVPAGGGAGTDFIVGINIKGEDAAHTEPSGTLPGTSPSEVKPMLYRKDGRPIPLWYDKQFPPLDPELLKKTREILEDKKKHYGLQKTEAYDTGDQKTFWVKDSNDRAWRELSATNMRTGTYSYLFIDDSLSIPEATLDLYVTEFDFMYSNVLSPNIGDFSDRDGNGKITVLLYNMNDSGSINMYMGGYFWMKDYMEDSLTKVQGVRSNEMDIVYIRGNEPTGWEQIGGDFYEYNLTTLVHECQHLIHFGVEVWTQGENGKASDVWIDEMMAMSTETIYFKEKLKADMFFTHPSMEGDGYLTDRIGYYSADPRNSIRNGHGLCYWDQDGDLLSNYALSYLMGQYLSIHSSKGQGIFKDILNYMIASGVHDYQGVAGAAVQTISGISSWEDLLKSYAVANMANQSAGLFGYNGEFILKANGPTLNKANVHNGGAVYRNVEGQWQPPSGTGPNIRFYDSAGTLVPATVASGCFASKILGDDSDEANILRDFRDEVLSGKETGQEMVNLYYQHAEEISSIIFKNPDIRAETKRLLSGIIPVITEILNGENVSIKSDLKKEIDMLCDDIREKAGPELKEVIEKVQKTFDNTMAKWR